jgi:hypothetical protein
MAGPPCMSLLLLTTASQVIIRGKPPVLRPCLGPSSFLLSPALLLVEGQVRWQLSAFIVFVFLCDPTTRPWPAATSVSHFVGAVGAAAAVTAGVTCSVPPSDVMEAASQRACQW